MIIRIFLITLYLGMPFVCNGTQEVIDRAHSLYEQGQFEQALSDYQTIENKSCATLYNMGNCCYKLARYPRALAFWRKAQRRANEQQAQAIISNINALFTQVKKTAPVSTLFDYLMRLLLIVPLIAIQLLFILTSLLIVWLLASPLWRQRLWLLVLIIIFDIVLMLILVLKYREYSEQFGIINAEEVTVFAGPDIQYHAVGKLVLLDQLIIEQTKSEFYKIKHKDLEGWVCADRIEAV